MSLIASIIATTILVPHFPSAPVAGYVFLAGCEIPNGFPYSNYFNGAQEEDCYGMVSAALDATHYGLDVRNTKPSVSQPWVVKRQKSEIWTKLDQAERIIKFDSNDVAWEVKYISAKLERGEKVPVALMSGNPLGDRHAVMAYAMLRRSDSNEICILVYDPDKRDDIDPNAATMFDTCLTYAIDTEGIHHGDDPMEESIPQRGDPIARFKGPYLLIDSGMTRFVGYHYYNTGDIAGNFDRFFSVQNFAPVKPTNYSQWEKLGEGDQ